MGLTHDHTLMHDPLSQVGLTGVWSMIRAQGITPLEVYVRSTGCSRFGITCIAAAQSKWQQGGKPQVVIGSRVCLECFPGGVPTGAAAQAPVGHKISWEVCAWSDEQ